MNTTNFLHINTPYLGSEKSDLTCFSLASNHATQVGFFLCNMSRKKIKFSLRKLVFERDFFKCVFCNLSAIPNKEYDGKNTLYIPNTNKWLELDHIIPFSKGGSCDANNLQTLCNVCNSKKYNNG